MSAPAAAAYLATLAKLQGISHARLDRLTGAGPRYLWRVQSGEIEKPAAAALLAIAQHVRAELRELQSCFLMPRRMRVRGDRWRWRQPCDEAWSLQMMPAFLRALRVRN